MARYCLGRPGWRDDLNRGLALARSADSLSFAAVVGWVYFAGIPFGMVAADDPTVREIEHALRIAERSGDDLALALARMTLGTALVHRPMAAQRDRGQKILADVGEVFRRRGHVTCALELQRAPLAPIRLRVGVHTGEVQLRDEGNYIGPTINRAARIRDLARGGQTVLSGTTEDLVADVLPADAWLVDLGRHELRGVLRPERVVQLCHPDLRNDFPPLRTPSTVVSHNLPVQLTSFVGRGAQITDVGKLLADQRLVTLTGAGGAGKNPSRH